MRSELVVSKRWTGEFFLKPGCWWSSTPDFSFKQLLKSHTIGNLRPIQYFLLKNCKDSITMVCLNPFSKNSHRKITQFLLRFTKFFPSSLSSCLQQNHHVFHKFFIINSCPSISHTDFECAITLRPKLWLLLSEKKRNMKFIEHVWAYMYICFKA